MQRNQGLKCGQNLMFVQVKNIYNTCNLHLKEAINACKIRAAAVDCRWTLHNEVNTHLKENRIWNEPAKNKKCSLEFRKYDHKIKNIKNGVKSGLSVEIKNKKKRGLWSCKRKEKFMGCSVVRQGLWEILVCHKVKGVPYPLGPSGGKVATLWSRLQLLRCYW